MTEEYLDESPETYEEDRPRRRKRRRTAPAWPWFFGGTMLGIFIGAVLVLGTLFATGGGRATTSSPATTTPGIPPIDLVQRQQPAPGGRRSTSKISARAARGGPGERAGHDLRVLGLPMTVL
jgi:hypothetical protein